MAKALVDGCMKWSSPYTLVPDCTFPLDLPDATVVAFASSASRFPDVLAECESRRLPLFVVSSNMPIPETVGTVVINGPNLGLLNLIMLDVFPRIAELLKIIGANLSVGEFHQASKALGSATAKEFARLLGLPPEKVGSGRDDSLAKVFLDVQDDYLGGFARIGIRAEFGRSKLCFALETNGRSAYFDGLMMAIDRYFRRVRAIEPGVYDLHKLVFPESAVIEGLKVERDHYKKLYDEFNRRAAAFARRTSRGIFD